MLWLSLVMVVLDNLSAHKADSMRRAIAACDCARLFLPPSSPDCTPIEQAISKLKAMCAGWAARTREALEEAVHLAIEAITRDDVIAWFAHAGYLLLDQGK
jgi:transposase